MSSADLTYLSCHWQAVFCLVVLRYQWSKALSASTIDFFYFLICFLQKRQKFSQLFLCVVSNKGLTADVCTYLRANIYIYICRYIDTERETLFKTLSCSLQLLRINGGMSVLTQLICCWGWNGVFNLGQFPPASRTLLAQNLSIYDLKTELGKSLSILISHFPNYNNISQQFWYIPKHLEPRRVCAFYPKEKKVFRFKIHSTIYISNFSRLDCLFIIRLTSMKSKRSALWGTSIKKIQLNNLTFITQL